MNNYRIDSLWRLILHPSLFSCLFSPLARTVKGHVSHVWFQWRNLLMTSVPALFKSNDCSGAWAGTFLTLCSRSTDDIFKWQFGDSAAISRLIEPLMSACFWFVVLYVREPDTKTGFPKYPQNEQWMGAKVLKIFRFHLQTHDSSFFIFTRKNNALI